MTHASHTELKQKNHIRNPHEAASKQSLQVGFLHGLFYDPDSGGDTIFRFFC
jgi:hypothetical protein